MPSITVYLSDELYHALLKTAKRKKKSKGHIIREALRQYIGKKKIEQMKLEL